ncbi:hypothetical protein EVAR_103065_1 [Eumeta japonica]|uniref:Uncharacterized protein n=1 Tax=Eumeta variegata TaxID=151549 RepID=A0A4C1WP45_EUMVA|nr:hypothetical protein EVAR_103065_1 [Eumeta japonica]
MKVAGGCQYSDPVRDWQSNVLAVTPSELVQQERSYKVTVRFAYGQGSKASAFNLKAAPRSLGHQSRRVKVKYSTRASAWGRACSLHSEDAASLCWLVPSWPDVDLGLLHVSLTRLLGMRPDAPASANTIRVQPPSAPAPASARPRPAAPRVLMENLLERGPPGNPFSDGKYLSEKLKFDSGRSPTHEGRSGLIRDGMCDVWAAK